MPAQIVKGDEDIVAAFHLDGAPVRGRYARLADATIDPILRRRDYPRPVALLLGEALTLAALVGALFKVEGRLSLQAQGDGPVNLLVADYSPGGALRGYARLTESARVDLGNANAMAPNALLGEGALVMTLEQGASGARYQGVVALDGETLAACAERYFERSEQTPTRIKLAVAEQYERGARAGYRSGGALMQRIAADETRGDTHEAWRRAQILFDTLSDAELVDPSQTAERVLYNLFHEEGVRMAEAATLHDRCSCSRERLARMLARFREQDIADMTEPDGLIHAHCQFCARLHLIAPQDVRAR